MMTNSLKSLKTFHHILLDYPIPTLNLLDINTLGKNWKGYTPKISALGKSLPDNPTLEGTANAPLPVIQRTIILTPTASNARETSSMEQLSTIVLYLHVENLIL